MYCRSKAPAAWRLQQPAAGSDREPRLQLPSALHQSWGCLAVFSCNIERHFATRQEGCGARSTGSASAAGQLQTEERCCIREARLLRPLSYLGAVAALASQRLHAAVTDIEQSELRAEVGKGSVSRGCGTNCAARKRGDEQTSCLCFCSIDCTISCL